MIVSYSPDDCNPVVVVCGPWEDTYLDAPGAKDPPSTSVWMVPGTFNDGPTKWITHVCIVPDDDSDADSTEFKLPHPVIGRGTFSHIVDWRVKPSIPKGWHVVRLGRKP